MLTFQKIKIQLVCPRCGEIREQEIESSPDMVDFFREKLDGMKMECSKCCPKMPEIPTITHEEFQLKKRLEEAGIPEEYRLWDKTLGESIYPMKRVVWNARDESMYVWGPYGIGKTRAMCATMDYYIRSMGKEGRFYRFSDYSREYAAVCKENMNEAYGWKMNSLEADIVILDDVDKARITDTAGELLYDILDLACMKELRCDLWMTANVDWRKFGTKFTNTDIGQAVVARIDRLISEKRLMEVSVGKEREGR